MSPRPPVLVVLAAGASRRLGTCKALVELGGVTVLEHLLAAGAGLAEGFARERGEHGADDPSDRPLVVTGAHHAAIAAAAPDGCDVLWNRAWARGRTGGVRLAAAARAGRDLCLAPVDVPLVPRSVFRDLAARWARAGAPAEGWLAPRIAADAAPPAGPDDVTEGAGGAGAGSAARAPHPAARAEHGAVRGPTGDAVRGLPGGAERRLTDGAVRGRTGDAERGLTERGHADGAARYGHPVIVGRGLVARLVAAGLKKDVAEREDEHVARADRESLSLRVVPDDRPLRALRAVATPLLALDVGAIEVLDDLDTPADLARLARLARRIRRE